MIRLCTQSWWAQGTKCGLNLSWHVQGKCSPTCCAHSGQPLLPRRPLQLGKKGFRGWCDVIVQQGGYLPCMKLTQDPAFPVYSPSTAKVTSESLGVLLKQKKVRSPSTQLVFIGAPGTGVVQYARSPSQTLGCCSRCGW